MSIIYNNQVVAGKYTQQVVADADTVNAGIIKLATEEQVIEGVDNTTAVTPFYLAQKQDKISAGDGIVIDNNEISCTVNPDEQTIVRKDNGTMQCIGQLTKSNTLKFDWEGTQAEYNVAYLNGTIQPDWYCYITDDEEFVDYADVCNQSLSNLRPEGEARFNEKANIDLDNLSEVGKDKLNNLVVGKANIDLTNITDIGIQVIKDNSKSFNLFDTILKDHILTYEESKGWALQGTYVYKDAVAGERYGYPDFYNKCLEEKNNSVTTAVTLGENTITMYIAPNGHQFYDIANKDAVDTHFTTYGMAWFYGIDEENERIFLPRNIWFEQLSIDEVGKAVEAGLPNHKHYEFASSGRGTSADDKDTQYLNQTSQVSSLWYSGYAAYNMARNSNTANVGLSSNPTDQTIYGKSNTVQPNAVKKLLYICVGNTEAQRTITDVVDVTTTENDTIPFGYSTYQKNAQPSLSWLKSEGQWNDGNAYITFYNWAVNRLGEAFASGYIKQVTETFDDYDLVINQDDMTFRLPLLDGSESIINDKFVDLTLDVSGSSYTAPANGWVYLSRTSTSAGQFVSLSSSVVATKVIASTGSQFLPATLEVKKGDVCTVNYTAPTEGKFRFIYAQGNGSLYFKVANAVQNLQIIDTADLIENYTTKSMVDGQWVYKQQNLSSAKTAGTYTLDLSNYLPSDGHVYEILCRIEYDQNTDGTNVYAHIQSDIIPFNYLSIGTDNTFGGVNMIGSAIIPAKDYLKLIIAGGNMSEGVGVQVCGYRRLGTNV